MAYGVMEGGSMEQTLCEQYRIQVVIIIKEEHEKLDTLYKQKCTYAIYNDT